LKSNPSLFISKSRLSVRQIPLFVTERLLKRLSIHAVHAFEREVKKGERSGLTADELSVVVEQPDEEGSRDEGQESGKNKKKKYSGKYSRVKQAKIVRQQERIDPVTGKGKSRGYGFIEMNTHGDALRVLRWANNNPDVGPLLEEWWKEELKDLTKLEKGKEASDEARLKRMNDELEKVTTTGAKKSKGSLIVEFSIENVQVVKRRNALQRNAPVCFP
jgi:nucleolar protein 4